MTSIRGIMNDPTVDSVTVHGGEGETLSGEVVDFDPGLNYISLYDRDTEEELSLGEPEAIDFHGTSARLARMPVDRLETFPLSGRNYSEFECAEKVDQFNELNHFERAPKIIYFNGRPYTYEGNFLLTAAKKSERDYIWVNEPVITLEEAVDEFLEGHIPANEKEIEEREEKGESWYNDKEITRTINNFMEYWPQQDWNLHNIYRIEYNLLRTGERLYGRTPV